MSVKNKKKLFLIDGMALIYRSYFAMINNPLITRDGIQTSAVHGFLDSMFKLIKDESPDYLAIVFDSKQPTFRHELYSEYKANREKMPDDLSAQIPVLEQIINILRIPIIQKAGYEADDLLATIACQAENLNTYIFTSDKDLMQVVTDRIFIYSPGNRFKPTKIYDKNGVKSKWGVAPGQIIDLLALMGDSSDNIPGVEGVGPKTAAKLLKDFGTIDNLILQFNDIKNERIRNKISNSIDKIKLSQTLVTIDTKVVCDFRLEESIMTKIDFEKIYPLLNKLELNSIISRIQDYNKLFINESNSSMENNANKKKYVSVNNKEKLNKFLFDIHKAKVISFKIVMDSNTIFKENIKGIAFCYQTHYSFYIPFLSRSNKDYNKEINTDKILNDLKPIFESSDIIKYGENLKSDYLVLKRFGIELKGLLFDTSIAGHLLYPQKSSYKIKDLTLEYLNSSIQFNDEVFELEKKQLPYGDLSISSIANHFCNYVDALFQIANLFKDKIDSSSFKNVFYNIETPLIKVLAEIENNGIYVNSELLKSLSITVNQKIKKIENKIYSISGRTFNINSPKQLSEILFDDLQLKEIKKRSTAIEVLEALSKYHPLPEIVLEYRHLSKLNNTYIRALPEYINSTSGRIHTSLNQTIVATGRLSSTNPNFQNIPIRTDLGREIRKSFQPQKKEYYILSADYSQIELRIMAHLSKEPELIRSFCEGLDIHKRTASLVFNIPEDEINSEQRRMAKIVNFGIMYGAGPFRISKELNINIRLAKDLIENYFATYSGIKHYIDKLIIKASKQGYVETLFGRKRFSDNLLSNNKNIQKAEHRALINMPIQGTAAELIKIAMINIQNKINSLNLKTKMILQVHDELLFEIPKYEIDNVSKMIKFEMENAIKLDVPIKVDYDYGASWYYAH